MQLITNSLHHMWCAHKPWRSKKQIKQVFCTEIFWSHRDIMADQTHNDEDLDEILASESLKSLNERRAHFASGAPSAHQHARAHIDPYTCTVAVTASYCCADMILYNLYSRLDFWLLTKAFHLAVTNIPELFSRKPYDVFFGTNVQKFYVVTKLRLFGFCCVETQWYRLKAHHQKPNNR